MNQPNSFVPTEDVTERLPDGRRRLVWAAGRTMTLEQARAFGLLPEPEPAKTVAGPKPPAVEPSEFKAVQTLQTTVLASVQAQRFAEREGLNLAKIKGTGKDGRILLKDVMQAAEEAE